VRSKAAGGFGGGLQNAGVRSLLRIAHASVGWVVGIAAGALVILAAVVGVAWLLTRPPSPESEVRELMAARGLEETVSVGDCRAVQRDSTGDLYRCDLRVDGTVQVAYRDGWDATLTTRTYCFRIPRSGSTTEAGAELQSLDC
jgi:hypothetical protein